MKVKIYEKINTFSIYFFILIGIFILVMGVLTNIENFKWWSTLFWSATGIVSIFVGVNYYTKRRKGELIMTEYQCEKYEVSL